MANINNNGTVIGRLAADPKVFENKDGSKKVALTVFADRNYRAEDGSRPADSVQMEAWVSNKTDGVGVFEHLHKGDLAAFGFTVRSHKYVTPEGETMYAQTLSIEDVTFLESRSVTQRRLAERTQVAA